MPHHFTYRPLDPDKTEIRLLNVRPDSCLQRSNDILDCHLEHFTFEAGQDPIAYNAISYVWGDPKKQRNIRLNGQLVGIPESAETALRNALRTLNSSIGPLYGPYGEVSVPTAANYRFWLDAVCIDQSNLAERGHQVSVMGHIYRCAQLVAIWLGEDDGSTAAALNAMDEIVDHCRKATDNFLDLNEQLWDEPFHQRRYSTFPLPQSDWKAIQSFFDAPWFRRFWVIQETVLSKIAICVRGPFVVPWSHVALAAQWLTTADYLHPINFNREEMVWPGVENAERMATIALTTDPLRHLLSEPFMFNVSDPRDMVFGSLGLWQASGKISAETRNIIKPDYSADACEVYHQFTRFAISALDDLLVLQCAQSHNIDVDCKHHVHPSWVTRLDIQPFDEISGHWKGPRALVSRPHCAAGNTITDIVDESLTPPGVLKLRGFLVDEVKAQATILDRQTRTTDAAFANLIITSRNLALKHLKLCPADALFALAVTLPTGRNEGRDDLRFQPEYHQAFSALVDWCKGVAPLTEEVKSCRDSILWAGHNRRVFVTKGGLLGMGPKDMQKGDKVCILCGGHAPFILRPAPGGQYTLIGDTYVYGIMDGEYIQCLDEQGTTAFESRWFELV